MMRKRTLAVLTVPLCLALITPTVEAQVFVYRQKPTVTLPTPAAPPSPPAEPEVFNNPTLAVPSDGNTWWWGQSLRTSIDNGFPALTFSLTDGRPPFTSPTGLPAWMEVVWANDRTFQLRKRSSAILGEYDGGMHDISLTIQDADGRPLSNYSPSDVYKVELWYDVPVVSGPTGYLHLTPGGSFPDLTFTIAEGRPPFSSPTNLPPWTEVVWTDSRTFVIRLRDGASVPSSYEYWEINLTLEDATGLRVGQEADGTIPYPLRKAIEIY